MAHLTPEACRAARAILKWSVRDLASHAGIAFSTVHLLERGEAVRQESRDKMVAAFATQNVEITNGDGTGARLVKKAASSQDVADEPGQGEKP